MLRNGKRTGSIPARPAINPKVVNAKPPVTPREPKEFSAVLQNAAKVLLATKAPPAVIRATLLRLVGNAKPNPAPLQAPTPEHTPFMEALGRWTSPEKKVENSAGIRPPTEGQKKAGNYKKFHTDFGGLRISVENPSGSTRSGIGPNGKAWSCVLPSDYGYILGAQGADGDHLDCYLSQNPSDTAPVFVLDQKKADGGKWDEHKVFLGFQNETAVRNAYGRAFDDGRAADRIGAITQMSLDDFKNWVKTGDLKKPMAYKDVVANVGTSEGAIKGWVTKKAQRSPGAPEKEHWYHKLVPSKPVEKWRSAGGVVYNDEGKVAIIAPKGGFGGYEWTFPKGTIEPGEHAQDAALREVGEESGLKGNIGEDLGEHEGTSSFTQYYLMKHTGTDNSVQDGETSEVKWVTPEEAAHHLNSVRDLRVLVRAVKAMHRAGIQNTAGFNLDAILNGGEFEESKHPRIPAGQPNAGQFAPTVDADKMPASGQQQVWHAGKQNYEWTSPGITPGWNLPKNGLVDVTNWPGHNTAAQWAATKISKMQDLHKEGKHDAIKAMDVVPKTDKPNKYQKAIAEAHGILLKQIGEHEAGHAVVHADVVKPKIEIGKSYKIEALDGTTGGYFAPIAVDSEGNVKGFESTGEGWGKETKNLTAKEWADKGYILTGITPKLPAHGPTPNLNINLEPALSVPNLSVLDAPKPTSELPPDTVDATVWNKIGPQKGSNPGGEYSDGKSAWYVKESKSGAIAKNEVLAAKLYQVAGSPVPEIHLAKLPGGMLGVASKMLPTGGMKFDPAGPMSQAAARENFATHAWLANWDAVGLENDNQVWAHHNGEEKPKLTTIDVGGSLLYRAQGAPKGDAWNKDVSEWDSMVDWTKNPQSAKVFAGMTPQQVIESGEKVASVPYSVIKKLVDQYGPGDQKQKDELASTLMARRDFIKDRVAALKDGLAQTSPPAPTEAEKEHRALPLPSSQKNFTDEPKNLSKVYGYAVSGDTAALKNLTESGTPSGQYAKVLLDKMNAGGVAGKDVFPNVPKPPETKINQQILFGMYHAAMKGDMATIEAIKTPIYLTAQYKEALLDAMKNPSAAPAVQHEAAPDPVMAAVTAGTPLAAIPAVPTPASLISAPPIVGGVNAAFNKKLQAIYKAAQAGDLAAVHAVQTNGSSKNTYSKMTYNYKLKVLGQMGAVVPASAVAPAQIAPKKPAGPKALKDDELPSMSEVGGDFISSNKANVEQNRLAIADLQKLAKAGDLAAVKTFPVTPSPKVQAYQQLLVEKMTPPAPEPVYEVLHGTISEISNATIPKKVKEATERIGRFLVLGKSGVNLDYGKGKKMTDATMQGTKAYNDYKTKLSGEERQAIRSYTASGYVSMNANLAKGDMSPLEKTAGGAIMKIANVIPEGGALFRRFTFNSTKDLDTLAKSVGKIIQDPGIISTAIVPKWSGHCHMNLVCGPGVRGLYVDTYTNGGVISANHGENECILPPNTRYFIKHTEWKSGTLHVDAVVLPTLSYQFYT